MAPVLDKVNNAIKMIDIHDIMHIRKSMYAKRGVNPWVMCTKKEEIDLLTEISHPCSLFLTIFFTGISVSKIVHIFMLLHCSGHMNHTHGHFF